MAAAEPESSVVSGAKTMPSMVGAACDNLTWPGDQGGAGQIPGPHRARTARTPAPAVTRAAWPRPKSQPGSDRDWLDRQRLGAFTPQHPDGELPVGEGGLEGATEPGG